MDAEEDTRYGRYQTGEELPAELGRRETRLSRKPSGSSCLSSLKPSNRKKLRELLYVNGS
jgi:hypothetical protein